MGLGLDSRLFTADEMSRRRGELEMEDDSNPETSIDKPDKFKPINWVQWSKDFENYVAQYNTVHNQEYHYRTLYVVI